MQLTFKNDVSETSESQSPLPHRSLKDLKRGEQGVVERIDLPEKAARRLMELGFVPGAHVTAAHSAPGGGPTVYRVDGSEIALRKDTAGKILLRAERGHRTASK